MTVFDAIHKLLKHQQSFVAFRLPGQIDPQLFYDGDFVQQKADENTFKNAFIVAPFNETDTFPELAYLNYKDYASTKDFKTTKANKSELQLSIQQAEVIGKDAYLEKAGQLINRMKQSGLDKIVFSRVISKDVPSNYDWTTHYARLCEKYPEAFVYFITLDTNHFWMGATPEVLVSYANGVGETMALAGTQAKQNKTGESYEWKQKELDEQAYVSRNILEILQQFQVKWLHRSELKTKTAGQIVHLVNHFLFALPQKKSPLALARALHPTPAVCGSPTREALEIIFSTEKHDREYYGGFLGPVGMENPMMLFVNLRCMQITGPHLILYSGGGITIDSNPVDEWYETEIKTGTLLSVIKNIS